MCPVGHPVYPTTGAKSRTVLLTSIAGIELKLNYSTSKSLSQGTYYDPGQVLPPPAGAGPMWSLNIQKLFYVRGPYQQVYLGNDTWDVFNQDTPEGQIAEGHGPDLRQIYQGRGLWNVMDKQAGLQYTFSNVVAGYSETIAPLVNFQAFNGPRVELEQEVSRSNNEWRSIPMLRKITDAFGREVSLSYEIPPGYGPMPRLTAITDSNGTISFSYNEKGILTRITWPDGAYQEFLYEAGQDDRPWLLTGVRDENQAQTASYAYDSQGRALSTQLATGADRYAVTQWSVEPQPTVHRWYDAAAGVIWRDSTWSDPVQVQLDLPSGGSSTMQTKLVHGMPRITSQSQPAGAGCTSSVRNQDYDSQGNVTWKEDFKGFRTCYANDLNRNLETMRVEGLNTGYACVAALDPGAPLPSSARRTSSAWHPVWRLESRVAEPRRLTTKVYNGQPDPFNGGATAWCAPSSGTLPDGSPIAVLCKQVEQATTDPNGALGFAATADSTVPSRVQQWTYNQYGQVLTYTDPRGYVTTNAYYSDTTGDHTKGDLNTVTNAKQQATTYTKYNPAGQWLEMVDANGITTSRTFDLRQRLKSVATGTALTSYDYWPTGLLKKVTLPDASSVSYGYDDAHRLTSITDGLGNSVTYTLDNSGNRTGEEVKDPSGTLTKTLARLPDALNRIQQVTGRE